eukprot:m51a1_g8416 hypothetical protein (598) ;mRNA; r:302415-304531
MVGRSFRDSIGAQAQQFRSVVVASAQSALAEHLQKSVIAANTVINNLFYHPNILNTTSMLRDLAKFEPVSLPVMRLFTGLSRTVISIKNRHDIHFVSAERLSVERFGWTVYDRGINNNSITTFPVPMDTWKPNYRVVVARTANYDPTGKPVMNAFLSTNASSQWMTYWDDEVRHQQVVLFLLHLPPWAAGPEADGVVICGSALDFLTPFFAGFPTSAHGLAFLFNNDENMTLLGSTLGAVTDNATNRPYTVWSHPTTTYRDTARAWLANTGGAREKASFTAGEAMYDVAKVAQTAGGTSDAVWWIVLVSPVKGFTGNVLEQNDIEMANNRNLVLIVSATVLAGLTVLVVLIVLSSNAIVRQIGRINQHLECVSKMDFDNGIPEFRSIVSEIKDMANQTSKMTIALQTFNVYVPSAIVHWLVANSIPPVISVTSTAATVLFLDVVNFTGMMESVGANTMIGILGTMFEDFSATLTRNKGVIDKYIGDAIMVCPALHPLFPRCPLSVHSQAFWNAPIPVADHSLMACQSAMEIRESLDKMNAETFRPEMGINMGVRIGISSGVVQAGNIGSSSRMNYTVLGDSVSLPPQHCQATCHSLE